jgi:hypothetical protein
VNGDLVYLYAEILFFVYVSLFLAYLRTLFLTLIFVSRVISTILMTHLSSVGLM